MSILALLAYSASGQDLTWSEAFDTTTNSFRDGTTSVILEDNVTLSTANSAGYVFDNNIDGNITVDLAGSRIYGTADPSRYGASKGSVTFSNGTIGAGEWGHWQRVSVASGATLTFDESTTFDFDSAALVVDSTNKGTVNFLGTVQNNRRGGATQGWGTYAEFAGGTTNIGGSFTINVRNGQSGFYIVNAETTVNVLESATVSILGGQGTDINVGKLSIQNGASFVTTGSTNGMVVKSGATLENVAGSVADAVSSIDKVTVLSGGTLSAKAGANASYSSLTLDSGSTLTMASGSKITATTLKLNTTASFAGATIRATTFSTEKDLSLNGTLYLTGNYGIQKNITVENGGTLRVDTTWNSNSDAKTLTVKEGGTLKVHQLGLHNGTINLYGSLQGTTENSRAIIYLETQKLDVNIFNNVEIDFFRFNSTNGDATINVTIGKDVSLIEMTSLARYQGATPATGTKTLVINGFRDNVIFVTNIEDGATKIVDLSDIVATNELGEQVQLGYVAANLNGVQGWYVNAIPEPSTYAAIFGALALGFVIYRRRK